MAGGRSPLAPARGLARGIAAPALVAAGLAAGCVPPRLDPGGSGGGRRGPRLDPRQQDPPLARLPLVRWSPSRPARPGCSWRARTLGYLGLRLLVEHCARADPALPIEIFPKPPGQPIADTLRRWLPPRCRVRPARGVDLGDPTKQVFEIAPAAAWTSLVPARVAAPLAPDCGLRGRRQSGGYFEYHPVESRTRYLFVRPGGFDPASIELLW